MVNVQYEIMNLFVKTLSSYLENFMRKMYLCGQKECFWKSTPAIAEYMLVYSECITTATEPI